MGIRNTYKKSSRKVIRSIAAYRVSDITKESNPAQSVKYADKIEIKPLKIYGSLPKAKAFEKMGEREKALLELNTILISNSVRENNIIDSKLLIELASLQKRNLISENESS